jgi:thymidylate synthase ThyX
MFLRPEGDSFAITDEGHQFLSNYITDSRGKVYAFKDSVSSTLGAEIMARFSRCSLDPRVLMLKEFATRFPKPVDKESIEADEHELLRKVVSEYGDDSVKQLAVFRLVVTGASNVLTKILERPRVGIAFLEMSTRYLVLDKLVMGEDGFLTYRYFIPPEFSQKDRDAYCDAMNKIFHNYTKIVNILIDHISRNSSEKNRDAAWRAAVRGKACDAARAVLPLSTTSTVGIVGTAQAIESLIIHLLANPLQEAQRTGKAMLEQVRKVAPVFFERTDDPERGGAFAAYLANKHAKFSEVTAKYCVPFVQSATVELRDFHPRNENVLIDKLPFAFGMEVGGMKWFDDNSDDILAEILESYVGERLNRRHRPGRMIEMVRYEFTFWTAYAEFRDLQRHKLVEAFEWTPVKGGLNYDTPSLVVQAGANILFDDCFRISSEFLFHMEGKYGDYVSQYSALFNNKILWGWSVNLRELMHIVELRTTPQGHPAYRKICQEMFAHVEQVHPKLAKTIKFINCSEDPELNRLAAERANAFKLTQMM